MKSFRLQPLFGPNDPAPVLRACDDPTRESVMKHLRLGAALAIPLFGVLACSSDDVAADGAAGDAGAAPPPAVESAAPDALPAATEADLEAVEARLLNATAFRMEFRIRSADVAEIEGELEYGAGGQLALFGSGTFGGDPVELSLVSTDGYIRGGNNAINIDESVPANLREAVVIGLTRMGLLHNLARLVENQAPDRAAGGVRDWVVATNVSAAEGSPPVDAAASGISFDIVVDGAPAGSATLWLDANGLPVYRVQTVTFDGGSMEVVEEYEVGEIRP